MDSLDKGIKLPVWKVLSILIGLPAISYLLSLMLLHRAMFSFTGWDFFSVFWLIITLWYAVQMKLVTYTLASEGYTLADIGFALTTSQLRKLIGGYVLVSLLILVSVESLVQSGQIDPGKLSDFANLSPTTLQQRIIYIIMGLFAGLSEEIVYRGFAIRSLVGHRINKWVSVILASIPFTLQHGLKAIPQFSWFFSMGLFFGIIFVMTRRLTIGILIHWLVIVSAVVAILSVLR